MPPPVSSDTTPQVCVMQILYVLHQGFVSQGGGCCPLPLVRQKTTGLRRAAGEGDSSFPPVPPLLRLSHTADMSAVSDSRRLCCVTQQTMPAVSHSRHRLLRDAADVSAVSCCVTQQTCPLCHTADMCAVSHGRHFCCVTQQTCVLCYTADMSAPSHIRHVCRVTQRTCLLCHTADMSVV